MDEANVAAAAAPVENVERLAGQRREVVDQRYVQSAVECQLPRNMYLIVHRAGRRAAQFDFEAGARAEADVIIEVDGGGTVTRPQVALKKDVAAAGAAAGAGKCPKITATLVVEPTLLTRNVPF